MKKIIFTAVLFSLLIGFSSNAYANADNSNKPAGYISLNTSKTIEVEPNIATVTFSVENTANDASEASRENNLTSDKVIKALKEITDEKTDIIKTSNFSVRPVYSTGINGKRVIKNYVAVNSVKVQTKDIQKVASFINRAINAGATGTDNLIYSYDNNKKTCNETYPQLLSELKTQAEILANAGGTVIDGLKFVNASCSNDSNITSNGRFYSSLAKADSTETETATGAVVEAGKIKIRVYVNADFYVK